MKLDDIRESGENPRKTNRGAIVRKTDTGLIHSFDKDEDESEVPPKVYNGTDKKDRHKRYNDKVVNTPMDRPTRGKIVPTGAGIKHVAGSAYSGKEYHGENPGYLSHPDVKHSLNLPDGGKQGGSHNHRIGEATGDAKFDGMMGKIAGSTEPVTPPSAASNKINDLEQNGPDMETINALNKMMYDMHTTMQTANQLMQKLMRGR